jgi:exopolysaccharide biosynthesis polyprenyl glycosylphosphotransferase
VAVGSGWCLGLVLSPRRVGAADGAVLIAVAVVVAVLSIAQKGLYRAQVRAVPTAEAAGVMKAAALAAVVVAATATPMTGMRVGLRLPAVSAIGSIGLLWVGRAAIARTVAGVHRRGRLLRPVLLVGAGEEARHLARQIERDPAHGYRIVGVVGPLSEYRAAGFGAPWVGDLVSVESAAERLDVADAFVARSDLASAEASSAVRRLLDLGLHIRMAGGSGIHHRRLRTTSLGREPVFYVEPVALVGIPAAIKRVIDVVVAASVLVLASPLLGAACVLIAVRDGRPLLFRQERVGRDGGRFQILKLRTMVPDAEARLPEVQATVGNLRTGPLFKAVDDPRVTPIGRVLRATSLDELPQLWNVLRGDMSLVGPRPALPSEVVAFAPDHLRRHFVRPGITGLWQVESRDSGSFEDVERHDVFYVENWSVALDLWLLVRTAGDLLPRAWRAIRTSGMAL